MPNIKFLELGTPNATMLVLKELILLVNYKYPPQPIGVFVIYTQNLKFCNQHPNSMLICNIHSQHLN